MGKIIVQRSHDTRFVETLSILHGVLDVVIASDSELGDTIESGRRQIDGAVLFHLTDAAIRAVEILLNERFNGPATPVAYLGRVGGGVRLPYGATHFDQAADTSLVPFLSRPRRIEVLIVEDDAGIRDVLTLSLSKHFVVDVAEDGVEALMRIRETAYDIVVLDVMLPVVSGDEVFRELRETRPDTAVLIITAHDTEAREIDYVFGGADGYLAKPFDSNRAFRQKVVDALRQHHERTAKTAFQRQAEEADEAWETYRQRMQAHL